MVKLKIDINPKAVVSAYVDGPFDKALRILDNCGFRVISLKENAQLRIQQGKDSEVSRYGNYTRESFVYVPKEGVFLARTSPALNFRYSQQATKAHENGNEFSPYPEQVRMALESSIEVPYDLKFVPTKKFGEEGLTVFAYGNSAEEYGRFLDDLGIKKMPVRLSSKCYVDKQEKAFVRQTWLWGLAYGFALGDKNLAFGQRLRGVREKVRVGRSKVCTWQ